MPIYEFLCPKCSLRFEKYFSKISDNRKEICPNCETSSEKVVSAPNFKIAEPTHIPKDIDLKVGKDAEKRWLAYEDRNKQKEKIRKETGSHRISKDADGNYIPLTVTKEDKQVSEKEGVAIRKELFTEFNRVKNDPKTIKEEIKGDD